MKDKNVKDKGTKYKIAEYKERNGTTHEETKDRKDRY